MEKRVSACELIELPTRVVRASCIDWGVTVDAYLSDAARVGNRFTARVYRDLSGINSDGMTIVTPEVQPVSQRSGYTLVRSLSGRDHYVIVSQLLEVEGGQDLMVFQLSKTDGHER